MSAQENPEMNEGMADEAMNEALEEALADMASDVQGEASELSEEEQAHAVLVSLKEDNEKLKDQLMRAIAETENVRRRAAKDVEDSRRYGQTAFAKDMVSVLENLMRATTSIPEEEREENASLKQLGDGVDMTLKELITAFEKQNITRIYPLGETFNHNLHQAVSQIEEPEAEPNSIIQVLQAGYQMHDRLLQPAMVVVAKGSSEKKLDTSA